VRSEGPRGRKGREEQQRPLADAICLDAYLEGFDMGEKEKCFQKSGEYDVHVRAGVDIRNETHFFK
jgi:hypothetical protein